jgi:RNA polymerase sigma-70 factor (ECF subfamily)
VDDLDDRELIMQAQRGSADASGALFERHWLAAWRTAYALTGRRELADDVAQDAFERVIRSLGSFDASRPFGPWLHRIVLNRARDVMRRERRQVPSADVERAGSLNGEVGGEARAVLAAIGALPKEQREVVILHRWAGHSLAEVAAIVGAPLGTVHSRLARGTSELRRRLQDDDA